ncbi:MAG: hypothetical protein ACJATI_003510 [Halioglobus sp.]|jgi:hypothetical protein
MKQIAKALLIGSIVNYGFDLNTIIYSDEARQFNIFTHSVSGSTQKDL